LGDPRTILDAGCGLGFTTAVLAEFFPKSQILGIDLAEDAIQYAKQTHQKASFTPIALDPDGERIGIFDLIFCFEIYPFSRNRNSLYQSKLLNNLAGNLSPGGKIIISQTWRNVDALPPVLEEVKQRCDGLHFKVIPYPHQRIPTWLPKAIALPMAKIGEFLTKKELVKRLIVVTAK
jgi:trans-aconitate methyltransferase